MKSCWIIKFKNGTIKFYSEQEYRKSWKERLDDAVLVEEHWFDVTKAKDTYKKELYK